MSRFLKFSLILALQMGGIVPAAYAAGKELPPPDIECEPGATDAKDCHVDRDTREGALRFIAHCQRCHGRDQQGIEGKGPGVLDSKIIDDLKALQALLLTKPKPPEEAIHDFTLQLGVSQHVDQLQRYMQLRRENALPPGKALGKGRLPKPAP